MSRRRKDPLAGIGAAISSAGQSATHKGVRGGVGKSLSRVGRAARHGGSPSKQASARAVTRYVSGDKTFRPTTQQIKLAWPTFNETQRARIGSALVSRVLADANSGSSPQVSAAKPLPDFLRKYNPDAFDEYSTWAGHSPTRDDIASIGKAAPTPGEVLEVGSLFVPVGASVRGLKVGADAIRAARAGKAAELSAGAEKAAQAGRGMGAASKAGKGAKATATAPTRGGIRSLGPTKAARTVRTAATNSKLARRARAAGRTKAGRAAIGTAKVGGKVVKMSPANPRKLGWYAGGATGASVLAQAPAAISTGDPGKLLEPITEGSGVVSDLAKGAGEKLDNFGIVGNAAADILELPTAVVPSTYLLGRALVKAAQGDDSELDAQLKSLFDTSALAGVYKGASGQGWEQLKTALVEHPIYSALEVSGAEAALGRGVGKLTRAGGERAPLELGGGLAPLERGRYSKDALKQALQKRSDRKRETDEEGRPLATASEIHKALNERTDRVRGGNEGARRVGRSREKGDAEDARPKRDVDADAVSLAVRGVIRSTRTFGADLQAFGRALDESYAKLAKKADDPARSANERGLARVKMEANRKIASRLPEIARDGNPEVIFDSAARNVQALRALDDELNRIGLLDPEQARRSRVIGAGRLHLGLKHGKPREQVAAVNAYALAKKAHGALTRKIEKLLEQRSQSRTKARRDKLTREINAAKAKRGRFEQQLRSKPPKPRKQIVDSEGRAITTDEIERQLREIGVEETGFLTLRPHQTERAANYVPANERPTLPKGALTGKALTEGAFDLSYDTIVNQRTRARGVVNAADAFDADIRTFQIGRNFPDGRTAKDAATHPEKYEIEAPDGQPLRVVRIAPMFAKLREIEAARKAQSRSHEHVIPEEDLSRTDAQSMHRAWDEATTNISDDSKGPFALIPETAFLRLADHFAKPSAGFKATQMANQAFKATVLATSPKWIAGNIIDPNFRTMLSGNLPFGGVSSIPGVSERGYGNLMRQVVARAHEKDPIQAAQSEQIAAPGMHLGAQLDQHVEIGAADFNPASGMGRLIRVGEKIPAGEQVHSAWKATYQAVFHANQKFIEDPVTRQLLGKALVKELRPELAGRMRVGMKIADEIVDELADGLLDPAKAVRLAKVVEETTGQWSGNSPKARYLLSTYAPFGMWTRAATTYVLYTLPAKHPIKTAILANIEQMTQDEREALGLSFFSDRPAPDNLRGAIPTESGGVMPFANYSSFGYFGDFPGALQASVLPQVNGALFALAGINPFGDPLTNEDGTPEDARGRLLAAGWQLMGAFVPGASRVQSIAEEDDGIRAGVEKQFPFTNAGQIDRGLYEGYLRNLSRMRQIGIDVGDSGGSSYPAPPENPLSGYSPSGPSNPLSGYSSSSMPWVGYSSSSSTPAWAGYSSGGPVSSGYSSSSSSPVSAGYGR